MKETFDIVILDAGDNLLFQHMPMYLLDLPSFSQCVIRFHYLTEPEFCPGLILHKRRKTQLLFDSQNQVIHRYALDNMVLDLQPKFIFLKLSYFLHGFCLVPVELFNHRLHRTTLPVHGFDFVY